MRFSCLWLWTALLGLPTIGLSYSQPLPLSMPMPAEWLCILPPILVLVIYAQAFTYLVWGRLPPRQALTTSVLSTTGALVVAVIVAAFFRISLDLFSIILLPVDYVIAILLVAVPLVWFLNENVQNRRRLVAIALIVNTLTYWLVFLASNTEPTLWIYRFLNLR